MRFASSTSYRVQTLFKSYSITCNWYFFI